MSEPTDGTEIQMIPVDRITVHNPRVRDMKKFREIVDSIAKIGLKQPIKVSPVEGPDGEPAHNLVYGQGRLEAYIALGQTEIPAIVTDLSEEESLIMSLVENVARRQRRPIELLQGIAALKERGYTDAQIAQKIGFSTTYVSDIRHLLEAGEERLLVAVENGQMPLNVAVDIAAADDGRIQDALADAYEKGHLRGKQLIKAKRLVKQRQKFGKARLPAHPDRTRRRTSSAALVRSLKNQAERQRHVIKRAEITSSRLRVIIQGLRVLLADENFLTLLRAENMHTLPAPVPEPPAKLRPWRPGIADTDDWRDTPRFAPVGADALVMAFDPEPQDAQTFWRAAQPAGIAGRLFEGDTRFESYAWYDALPVRVALPKSSSTAARRMSASKAGAAPKLRDRQADPRLRTARKPEAKRQAVPNLQISGAHLRSVLPLQPSRLRWTTMVLLEGAMREVQLRDAKARLSALVEDAAHGRTAVITRHGKPRAVILGIDEWNRLRDVPSFGRLLAAAPLDDGDLPPRDSSPPRDAAL